MTIEDEQKKLEKYYKKLKKQELNIDKQFKKGKTTKETEIGKLTKTKTTKIYEELIKPLIKKEKNIPIIMKNKQKISFRLQYITKIIGLNQQGNSTTLATITETGRTIEEIKNQYQKLFHQGNQITSNNITEIEKKIQQKNPQAKITKHENGIITKTMTTIIFRKGI